MELNVKKRTILGKKVKYLRRDDLIPAELFGRHQTNQHLSVSAKEFTKLHQELTEGVPLNIKIESGEKILVLISNIQVDPISRKFLSIDFRAIHKDEKIKTKIAFEFEGEAPAVKEGDILVKVINEVEIEALPQNIPSSLKINLNSLTSVGQSIHIKDIDVPKDVKIFLDPETVITTITERAKEEVKPEGVEEVEEGKDKTEKEKGEETEKSAATEETKKEGSTPQDSS